MRRDLDVGLFDTLTQRELACYLDGLSCIRNRWDMQREQRWYAERRDMRELQAFERGINEALSESFL